jgi:transcription antitermination factor NusA-like protein
MEEILYMNALEKISRVSPKDCITENNVITYFVNGKEMGKAIGKEAKNIKELEGKLKKKIEIIGNYKEPEEIIEKTFDVKIQEKSKKKDKIILKLGAMDKKKVLGKFNRFKKVKEFVKRNHKLEIVLN